MTGIPVRIAGQGGRQATVSSVGALVTSPWAYDETVFNELAESDTAYSFYKPRVEEQLVLTGIYAVADKQVSGSVSASVVIYETTSIDSTTVSKVLLQTAMVQDQIQLFAPLNILVKEGAFVNAKTTDDDVHMTITGYFLPAVGHHHHRFAAGIGG